MSRPTLAVLLLVAVTPPLAPPARACEPSSGEVRALVAAGRFEEAEQRAASRAREEPESLEARLDLASVYLRWAQKEQIQIDLEALGLAPGETGTVQITDPAMASKAFRGRIELDPARATQAATSFERVLESWPLHVESHFCVTELYQRLDDVEGYLRALERAARVLGAAGAASADDFLRFPRYYDDAKRYDLAARSFEVLSAAFPSSASLVSSHGATLAFLGDLPGAIERFRQARALAPQDPLVLHNLSVAASLLGELELARDALGALAPLDPDPEIRLELAFLATALDPGEAGEAWAAYLSLPVQDAEQERWIGQLRGFAAAVAEHPDDRTLVGAARSLMEGRTRSAVALLHGVAGRRPEDPSVRFLLAQGLELEGFPKTAFAHLQAALALGGEPLLDVTPESLRFEAGRVALKAGRYDEGVAHLEWVGQADPSRENIQYLLGWAHAAAGHEERARHYFAECLRRDNNADYARYCRRNLERSEAAADP